MEGVKVDDYLNKFWVVSDHTQWLLSIQDDVITIASSASHTLMLDSSLDKVHVRVNVRSGFGDGGSVRGGVGEGEGGSVQVVMMRKGEEEEGEELSGKVDIAGSRGHPLQV